MPRRYIFDRRDGSAFAADEEGIELPNIESVQEEAALSLADMARNVERKHAHSVGHRMAIEVRDESGPILKLQFIFEADPNRS